MKRFPLVLSDRDYYEFLQAFPGHGMRTALLRKVVHRLVERAKTVGVFGDLQVDQAADRLFGEKDQLLD